MSEENQPVAAAPSGAREITSHKVNGLNEALTITARDERGPGNANHEYRIDQTGGAPESGGSETLIKFQKGPIKEAGVNGISNEALLAVVKDRLEGFQAGEFASEDNAQALEYVNQAMAALHKRTKDRLARGVEGENKA